MAISKSTQDCDYEFLDLSGVDDDERKELKSTLFEKQNNEAPEPTRVAEYQSRHRSKSSSVNAAAPVDRFGGYRQNSSKDGRNSGYKRGGGHGGHVGGQPFHYYSSQNFQSAPPSHYQQGELVSESPYPENEEYQEYSSRGNRPKPTNWTKNRKPQSYYQYASEQNDGSHMRRSGYSGSAPQGALMSQTYVPRNQRKQDPMGQQRGGRKSSGPVEQSQGQYRAKYVKKVEAARDVGKSETRIDSEMDSLDNNGWNGERPPNDNLVISENVSTETLSTSTSSTVTSSGTADRSSSQLSPNPAAGSFSTIPMNPNINQNVTSQSQQGGHGISQQPAPSQIYAPMQYQQGAVYPTMPMIPQPVPSNVYVGNVTANVSVHGYMHAMQPHYAFPNAGAYVPSGSEIGATNPIDTQNQQGHQQVMNGSMGGNRMSGNNNRRGRGRTISGSSGPRRDFTPRPVTQDGQQQMINSEQQVPTLLTSPPGIQYFMAPYQHYYQPHTIHGHSHQVAQHAMGHPLYVNPMPMYGASAINYAYPPGGLVYSVVPDPSFVPVAEAEAKPEDVIAPEPMWSPHPPDHLLGQPNIPISNTVSPSNMSEEYQQIEEPQNVVEPPPLMMEEPLIVPNYAIEVPVEPNFTQQPPPILSPIMVPVQQPPPFVPETLSLPPPDMSFAPPELPLKTEPPPVVDEPIKNVPKFTPGGAQIATQKATKESFQPEAVDKVAKAAAKLAIKPSTDRFGGGSNKHVAWNTKKLTNTVSVTAIPPKETPPVKPANPPPPAKSPSLKPEAPPPKEVKRENKEVTASVTPKLLLPSGHPVFSLAPPPQPLKNDPKPSNTWASLFQSSQPKVASLDSSPSNKRPIAKVHPYDSSSNASSSDPDGGDKAKDGKPVADEWSLKLADFLQKYNIDNNSISILPRGLLNHSNYCYINAILQALVSCPPFYHLMRDMPVPPPLFRAKGSTPVISAMQELINEFTPRKIVKERGANAELITDQAFEPLMIYKMTSGIFQIEGRQEDAEEFLCCILNRLNDEMLELIKLIDPKRTGEAGQQVSPSKVTKSTNEAPHNEELEDGDDWQVIGSRNKGTITRSIDFGRTPVSDIFRGKLKSRVHREGDHATDNIQPFFTLQLDIERATSVREALELLVGKDPLEGVTSSKTNQEVTAWQQVTIEELPVVLVLHLKYFDYKVDGCTKILKPVEFPIELKIDQKLLSSKTKYNSRQRTYKLFAVVYHEGKEASKGHYLTDAFHIGHGSWIRYDDSIVRIVSESQVLRPQPPRIPYLLYYRRNDTINTASSNSFVGANASGAGNNFGNYHK